MINVLKRQRNGQRHASEIDKVSINFASVFPNAINFVSSAAVQYMLIYPQIGHQNHINEYSKASNLGQASVALCGHQCHSTDNALDELETRGNFIYILKTKDITIKRVLEKLNCHRKW
uniref:Uncharacterized protein n=1 Tax=Glossina austeni TaxID=7395 RepID=A0A1A9VQ41_GLOAU